MPLMNRLFLLISLMLLSVSVAAQRQLVVCDVETFEPISKVSVTSSAGTQITDSLGIFSVPDTCKSISLTHLNYESRLLRLSEVRDTVYLVSKDFGLHEVVVFGKGKDDGLRERINNMVKINKTDAQLLAIDPSSGGNLLGFIGSVIGKLIPAKKSSKTKRREKAREILENY